jgi:hypothetical protein
MPECSGHMDVQELPRFSDLQCAQRNFAQYRMQN